MKIKWKVQEAPTGRYRAFHKRGWPSASYADTDRAAVQISCEDSYEPRNVKTGEHAELKVGIAFHNPKEEWAEKGGFTWRYLKARFATLKDAKQAAEEFIKNNPDVWPK